MRGRRVVAPATELWRLANRIRNPHQDKSSKPVAGKPGDRPNLTPLIGGPLNIKLMEQQFDEVMRLTASIKQGTVTASLRSIA
jgi:TnpA family transposase